MTTQPSCLKNDAEPEERRRKRVKRVDQQPPEGKREKPQRTRNGFGDPRRTTNHWLYMIVTGLDFG
ncbi:hypothetical protein MTR_8g046010 [Medicago truncatula]|uniref:Uncharacterized protein n=1 Tax=Medicago truncatula TaxID=3880 RepID=G7L8H7_MEDTR|nr:hypothetical protein MTR_8g046010 [Medicago truncatula]